MSSEQLEITFHKRIASIPAVEFIGQQSVEGFQVLRQKSIEIARERVSQLPVPPKVLEKVEELKGRIPELQERATSLKERIPELKERALQLKERAATEYKERTPAYLQLLKERILPFIAAFDAFVHKRLDVVEEKYPFWLQAPGPEILGFLQERRVEYTEKVTIVFEEKVKVPAIGWGKELDLRSKPLIDYAVSKIPVKVDQSGTEFQYQRALEIGKNVKGQAVVYSTEQLKQLQERNPKLKTVSDTAATVPERVRELRERAETLKQIPLLVRGFVDERIQPIVLENYEKAKVIVLEQVKPAVEEKVLPLVQEKASLVLEHPEVAPLLEIYKAEAPLKEKASRLGQYAVERSAPAVDLARSQAVGWLDVLRAKIAA